MNQTLVSVISAASVCGALAVATPSFAFVTFNSVEATTDAVAYLSGSSKAAEDQEASSSNDTVIASSIDNSVYTPFASLGATALAGQAWGGDAIVEGLEAAVGGGDTGNPINDLGFAESQIDVDFSENHPFMISLNAMISNTYPTNGNYLDVVILYQGASIISGMDLSTSQGSLTSAIYGAGSYDLRTTASTGFYGNYTNPYGFDGEIYDPSLDFTIEEVSSAPEPSTWTLMIAGVAMIGGMLRFSRRRRYVAALTASANIRSSWG